MSTKTDISFLSSDGTHQVHGVIYRPDTAPKGIIQIVHGMIDHIGRYEELAQVFCAAGYVVGGEDHLGHGKTVWDAEEFGFFAEKDGVEFLLRDIHAMTETLRKEFPGLPVILFGHSMGSFLTRLYVSRYGKELTACIIHGTGGPNPALPVGKALAAVIRLFGGSKYRSSLLANMAFMGYNSHFDPSEGKDAWLSRDTDYLHRNSPDPLTGFIFTVAGYQDLFRMVGDCNAKRWFKTYPKTLPTLVISGNDDPVGAYGKGPSYVYKQLLLAGVDRVNLQLYEGARHELFNETNRDAVCDDLLSWMNEVLA